MNLSSRAPGTVQGTLNDPRAGQCDASMHMSISGHLTSLS